MLAKVAMVVPGEPPHVGKAEACRHVDDSQAFFFVGPAEATVDGVEATCFHVLLRRHAHFPREDSLKRTGSSAYLMTQGCDADRLIQVRIDVFHRSVQGPAGGDAAYALS